MRGCKKLTALFAAICCCLSFGIFGACAREKEEGTLSVVCSFFPHYDWLRALTAGLEHIELTLLIGNGADIHSYQPTVGDMARILKCDLFVYVGGESDEWAEAVLAGRDANKDMKKVKLLTALGDAAVERERPEGAEADDHEHTELDEHVWLSVKNAAVLTETLLGSLIDLDPANKERYENNAERYKEKLNALDERFGAAASGGVRGTLLFADRFPFRYLLSDYQLDYYAAFDGCSSDVEASAATVSFLISKTNELSLPYICVTESSDRSLAETIKNGSQNKDQEFVVFNSLQSVKNADIKNGATYVSLMEQNVNALSKALG